ncbi:Filament domain-containing protein [Rhizoctonia solani AG-1 IA]|uniref:Filament domain-containing protein n=1 Tax=Thanatephorus cucumeris (strain AG1-IA) TaxID=983506 RepID=L8WPB1_THACA|nr:Filament domain-containing protein [Rhizoctonia solani AG-1 IA]
MSTSSSGFHPGRRPSFNCLTISPHPSSPSCFGVFRSLSLDIRFVSAYITLTTMIALRHWLGKTGAPSCTYESKCCGAVRSENAKLRELAIDLEARLVMVLSTPRDADIRLQRALDENALQVRRLNIIIAKRPIGLESRLSLITAAAAYPADYATLRERVSQLEAKLADTQDQLTKSTEELEKSKAHITVLQSQREQLVLELEQVEDGFQAEVEKLQDDLQSWKVDLSVDSSEDGTIRAPTIACPPPPPKYTESILTRGTRAPSVTSADSVSTGALFEASLERTKAATRIWALEDEVERMRSERDSLRRRLGAGRESLIQLKRQASEVRMSGGKGRMLINGRGMKSESQLTPGKRLAGRKPSTIQLNTLIRLPVHGEPLTPETSDDNASLEIKF